ncbi:MAG TPA: C69 family dipeptidase [Sandaracinaceae bacterium LLY-WYZ-13_1]|nr:C69 family dipeptidase [Sandaracinaceae bacterium LLY-WYZ-13_1]
MCDTMVALGNATRDGVTLFAKNSDRHPNEAQAVERVPAATHPPGSRVRCTYLAVPQAPRTHAALLCRPFWMWGAEMGVNEHGLAIGNQAIFTKVPHARAPALTGMDLVRLGLERARSADEALAVITALLEAHGQGGECGYDGALRYHNGFLIADRGGAWVLETAGRHWVAERVRDVRSISNRPTIRGGGDRRSEALVAHAVAEGWTASPARFDFAADLPDRVYTPLAAGGPRCARTATFLRARRGTLRAPMLMALLRSHAAPPDAFDPADGLGGADVCMHAGFGPIRRSHTVGSLVCRLGDDGVTPWVTGTSTPCTGIFAPVWLDAPLPSAIQATPGARADGSLFWRHERFARAVQRDWPRRHPLFAAERDALERDFVAGTDPRAGAQARRAHAERCFERADAARARWAARVEAAPVTRRRPLFERAWRRFDRRAQLV